VSKHVVGYLLADGSVKYISDLPLDQFLDPLSAYAACKFLIPKKKEHFVAFYLNARNSLIKKEIISVGTLTTTLVHPREVFHPAVKYSAARILVCHNHPSGDSEPSAEDLALTRRLRQAGDILGIELVDHIIVAKHGFCSLKERGYL